MSDLLCATCVNSIRCPTWAEWMQEVREKNPGL